MSVHTVRKVLYDMLLVLLWAVMLKMVQLPGRFGQIWQVLFKLHSSKRLSCFPADDELGDCKASLVSPEHSVLSAVASVGIEGCQICPGDWTTSVSVTSSCSTAAASLRT